MFEKYKQKKNEKNTAIFCVHGFGVRRKNEYDNFKLWLKDTKYTIITFNIFNNLDENDTISELWIKRCENKYINIQDKYDHIIIVGFSMGGVIATYLASKYNPDKLFLISPAFDYIHFTNIASTIYKKLFTKDENNITKKLSTKHLTCFMEVVDKCKDAINLVNCPVCLVQGDSDEVIPLRSSTHAFEKIPHDNKFLFIIHNGKHRLMYEHYTANETFQLFRLFINNQILTQSEFAPEK